MDDIVVSTIYCDDIREELAGKQSYMGVYNTQMLVGEFPVSIPKLCVSVSLRLVRKQYADGITVRVLNGTNQIAEVPIPENDIKAMWGKFENDGGENEKFILVNFIFLFMSLQISSQSIIRARVYVGDKEYKGNGLTIRLLSEVERSLLSSQQIITTLPTTPLVTA